MEKVLRVDGYFRAKRAAEIWAEYKDPLAPYLVKYTKRRFAEELLRLGQFRLSPADKYRDSENPAIRDTELEFSEEIYGATVSAPEGADYRIPRDQWKPLPVIGNVQSRVFLESDYYTWCFGNRYEYRLFDDFGADACLIIKDPPRFVEQVKDCMAQVLPGWKFSKGNVMYRDPHHPILNDSVCFSKHFRYAYQQEFRLAWQPPTTQERLNYMRVAMGSLEDYCDMLVL